MSASMIMGGGQSLYSYENQSVRVDEKKMQNQDKNSQFVKSASQLQPNKLFQRKKQKFKNTLQDSLPVISMNQSQSIIEPSNEINDYKNLINDQYQYEVQNKDQNPINIKHIMKQNRLQSITPELAANVVKDYILPMFENDGKKFIKRKKNKGKTGSVSDLPQDEAVYKNEDVDTQRLKEIQYLKNGQHKNSVYAEMKLSKILQDQIYELKNEILQLKETIQNFEFQNEINMKTVSDKSKEVFKFKVSLNYVTNRLKQSEQQRIELALENENMTQQISQLKDLFIFNEDRRREFSDQLQKEKSKNEKIGNNCIEYLQRAALLEMENDVMGEKLQRLYDAMDSLGTSKVIQDKYEAILLIEQREKISQAAQIEILQMDYNKVLGERDDCNAVIKDQQGKLLTLQVEKGRQQMFFKDKVLMLEKEKEEAITNMQNKQEEFLNIVNQMRIVTNEREKLKQKIQKLKKRRIIDFNQKICRSCGKEYLESDNYNWSCRIHRSQYGGEMWWCCGKTSHDAPGCKYSKHESKNDDEEDKEKVEDDIIRLKALKCYCCKEKGHKTENCTKDPNLRQNVDTEKEQNRILEIKEKKKLLQDSSGINSKLMELLSKKRMRDIFGEDIMSFDDYNYGLLNDFIFNAIRSTIQSDDRSSNSSFKIDDEDDDLVLKQQPQKIQTPSNLLFGHQQTIKPKKLFNREQISNIVYNQKKDVFEDLIHTRIESTIENLQQKNFIDLDLLVGTMITTEQAKNRRFRRGAQSQANSRASGTPKHSTSQANLKSNDLNLSKQPSQFRNHQNSEFMLESYESLEKRPSSFINGQNNQSAQKQQNPHSSRPFHLILNRSDQYLDELLLDQRQSTDTNNQLKNQYELSEGNLPILKLSQQNVQNFEQEIIRKEKLLERQISDKKSSENLNAMRINLDQQSPAYSNKSNVISNQNHIDSKDLTFGNKNQQQQQKSTFFKNASHSKEVGTPRNIQSEQILLSGRQSKAQMNIESDLKRLQESLKEDKRRSILSFKGKSTTSLHDEKDQNKKIYNQIDFTSKVQQSINSHDKQATHDQNKRKQNISKRKTSDESNENNNHSKQKTESKKEAKDQKRSKSRKSEKYQNS
eukprot:403361452